jgi:mutator protein MutT
LLKIQPPNYECCPFCKTKLLAKVDDDHSRKYCPSCDWVYYPQVFNSVAAIIIENNKVLLVERGREPYKNTWMFPGGFVEYGEHPEETLRREIREETGLRAKKISFFKTVQTVDDPRAPGNLILFYRVEPYKGLIKTDKKENIAVNWFSLDRLPKIGWKSHKYIMRTLKKEK